MIPNNVIASILSTPRRLSFFPFADNIGCTPSACYQPDCGGTLREIQSQEIYHSLSINLVHFIHILMTPSTSSLSDLLYIVGSSLAAYSNMERISFIIYHKHIHQRHHKCPLANFLASTYIFNCNVFLVYVI